MQDYYLTFASAYGSCNYSASTYQNSTSCTTSGGTTGNTTTSNGGGSLVDTGFVVLAVVVVACVIAFTALVVRFWRRPNHSIENPTGNNTTPPTASS